MKKILFLFLLLLTLIPALLFSQANKSKKPFLIKSASPATSSFQMTETGEKISKTYLGYKNVTEEISPELSVQVKYDEKYRASKLEIKR